MAVYHWFWGILIFATLFWYSTVTVYVAFKGLTDIRQMLEKLGSGKFDPILPHSENVTPKK
jgi:hypothetical protein